MRNISSKTDNVGDVLPASDFNINHRIELQNIVTDAGFSLDPEGGPDTDTDMLGKSLTIYSNASQYYADTGVADAYEIDRVGNLQPLDHLLDGAIVYFKAANANTGSSTINVDGIGVKDLVDNTGAALVGGEILADEYTSARYNSSTDDFELITTPSRVLTTWINSGNDFYPVVANTGTIGSLTNPIGGAYFGTSKIAYFSGSSGLRLYHDSADGYISSLTGSLTLSADGDVYTANSSNLFIESTASLYFSGLLGLRLYHDSANGYISSLTGNLTLSAVGDIYTANSANLFIETSASLYFSGSSGLRLYHDSANGYISSLTGDLLLSAVGDIYTANSANLFIESTASLYFSGTSGLQINHTSANAFFTCDTGYMLFNNTTANAIYFYTNNANRWFISGAGDLFPGVTATYDIGSAGTEVDNIYCVTLVESSDEVEKTDFEDTLGLDFILDLQPKSYKMNKGKNRNRKHGLVAQEVLSSVEKLGKINADFAAVVHDEESGKYGLSYSQFIAPIIKSIQELNDKIESLIGTL